MSHPTWRDSTLPPMTQLVAFCDWERKYNPPPPGGQHIAEWAALEIERLHELADSEGTRAVEYLRRARKAEAELEVLARWMAEALGVLRTVDEDAEDGGDSLRALRERGEKLVEFINR